MKTSRFTDAQIAFVLREAGEGTLVDEVCFANYLTVKNCFALLARYCQSRINVSL